MAIKQLEIASHFDSLSPKEKSYVHYLSRLDNISTLCESMNK